MSIPVTKKVAAPSVKAAVKSTLPTDEVVEEVHVPARERLTDFDLEAWMAKPEELSTITLRVAHILSQSGKDAYVGSHNGVTLFVNAQPGVTLPDIVLGKAAVCRVTFPKHGGYKAESDSRGVTVCVFASAVELAG